MAAKHKLYTIPLGLFLFIFIQNNLVLSQNIQNPSASHRPEKPVLIHAAMCEGINGYTPQNTAVVFSIEVGKVSCFTSFDPVPEETNIYHRWFYRDKLSTKKKLHLKPPRWSTFSSIQLREVDKGPWRVEINDEENNIIRTLRFSIVD